MVQIWVSSVKASLPLIIVFLMATVPGCRQKSSESEDYDHIVHLLTEIIEAPNIPIYFKNHAELAISKWSNGIVDREPITVYASLSKPQGVEQTYLAFILFDEDQDIAGLVVQEEYTNSNGVKTILQENYPAYIQYQCLEVMRSYAVPIHIRDKNQRKDEKLWQVYTTRDINDLMKEDIEGGRLSEESPQQGQFWEDNLPPVYISIPKPNRIDVWIWIYDRAGNKSEPVKLLDLRNANS